MTSDSYWAPTPARNFFSASGMPSRSNVFLMSSGTSSQLRAFGLGRLEVVEDRLEVDAREVAAPRGHGLAPVRLVGLEAEVEHPLRLVLVRRDLAHDVGVEARARLEDGRLGAAEAVLVLADVDVCGFRSHSQTSCCGATPA